VVAEMKAFYLLLLVLSGSTVFSQNTCLTTREQLLISHVQTSITRAENLQSKLSSEVLDLTGMSSPKVRHFLNNLCSIPDVHYLEIGCWQGSTFVASMYENYGTVSTAVAIDNWSEFGGPKQEFLHNCNKFLPRNYYSFYEKDCFAIDVKSICPGAINVYFYDGAHTQIDQEQAFTYYNSVLDDLFVAVVDDWNHPPVPLGTREAFRKLGYQVLFEAELPSRGNKDIEYWWNGLYVAVIRKPSI
jgi:hypothetical protein